jgi:2-methylcitrate dehydratase PrpD
MDDNHAATGIKGGSIMVPTMLAVGERELASGRDAIAAIVAGYEVQTRIGLAIRPGLIRRGGHATGNSGSFGSATVAGRLLALDRTKMSHALAGAASQTYGLNEIPSSGRGQLKHTFVGMAAAGGVRSALLAEAGITGPETSLDVGSGFSRMFDVDDSTITELTKGLGIDWEILNVNYKIYAQNGYIQPISEALGKVRSLYDFEISEIESVWIGVSKYAHDEIVAAIRYPKDLTDALFSANFGAALYLCRGGASFSQYDDGILDDLEIRSLSERVVVAVDEEIEGRHGHSRPRGAKVVVRLKSGETYESKVENLRTLSEQELDEKFRELATVVLDRDRVESLIEVVHTLESVRDISRIAELLVRRG